MGEPGRAAVGNLATCSRPGPTCSSSRPGQMCSRSSRPNVQQEQETRTGRTFSISKCKAKAYMTTFNFSCESDHVQQLGLRAAGAEVG